MYTVKLNDEYIHELDVNSNKRLSAGVLAEEVNQIPSFSFTIPVMNPAFSQELHDRVDIIKLTNTHTNEDEFDGHLLTHKQVMSSDGKLCIKAIAEGHLGYLCDSIQMYHNYVDTTPESFLTSLLTNHNAYVTASGHPEKRIILGTVNITRSDYKRSKTTAYRNTLEEIRVNLIDRIGGEIRVRRVNGSLVLDYLDRIGTNSDTKIELAKNMKSLSVDVDSSNIVTRLIPLGAQLSPGDSAERLTISSVNGGKPYIDDTAGISKYGIIVGTVEFDDITVASNLKSAGQAYLTNNNRIRKAYECQALDLSLIQDDHQPLVCGNSYYFVNSFMNLNESLRLIGRTVDIYKPYTPTLKIGDKTVRITDVAARTAKLIEYDLPQQKNEILASAKGIATDIINAGINGYVVVNPNEILIMDTPNKSTATKVWRWNSGGFGYSNNGYNGPYDTAITMNGSIVADFITAGVLRGLEILNGNGKFHVHTDGTVDAAAINITGGSINISTNSESYDVVQLSCGAWRHKLSPLEWILENSDTDCQIVAQAGAIFFKKNGTQTMFLNTDNGSVGAAQVAADELLYKDADSGNYYSVENQINAIWNYITGGSS